MAIEAPLALGDEQDEVDAAWAKTIARRLDDLESGRVQGIDGDVLMDEIQAKIDAWPG